MVDVREPAEVIPRARLDPVGQVGQIATQQPVDVTLGSEQIPNDDNELLHRIS
jgi:hypothetical protein